jgi:hypothetical protein
MMLLTEDRYASASVKSHHFPNRTFACKQPIAKAYRVHSESLQYYFCRERLHTLTCDTLIYCTALVEIQLSRRNRALSHLRIIQPCPQPRPVMAPAERIDIHSHVMPPTWRVACQKHQNSKPNGATRDPVRTAT